MSLETFDWKGYLQYIGYPEDQIPDSVSDEELLDIRRHWAQTVYQEELAAAQDDPFLETPKERREYARDSLLAVAPEFRSEFGLRDPQPAERAFSAQEFHDWVVNNEYQDGNLDFYLKTFAASRINKNTKYEYPYLEGLTKKEFQDMFMEQNGIDPDLTTIEDIRNGNFGPAAMAQREEEESNLPRGSAMRQGWLEFKKLTGLTTETFGDFLGVEWMRNIGRGITENAIKTIDEEGYRGKYQESLVDTVKNEGIFAGAGKVLQMAQENWATTGVPLALAGMSAMFGVASRNPRLAAQSLASARASLAAATSADVAMGTGAAATVGRVGASTIAKSLAFASAMASGLEVGAVREELEQKGKEEGRQLYDPNDPGDAVAWGLLSAALDHIGNMATFVGGGGLIRAAKGLTQAQQTRALEAASAAARQAAREAGKSWGRKIVEAMGIEGVTESLQELPSIMAARNKGVEYTPKEIRDRMIDAGVVGAFMGGGMRTVQSIPETLRERARRMQSESETTQTPAAPTPPTNVPPAPNQPPPAGFDEKLAWNTNFAEIDNGNGWAAWDGYNVGYGKTKEEASQALLDQSNANKDQISGTPTSTANESRISFGNGGELVVTGNGHQGVIKRIIDLHNSNDNHISFDGTRMHTFDATALSGLNEKDFRKYISQNWGNTTLRDTRGVRQARVDQVDIGINFDAEIRDNNGNVIGRRAELDLDNYRDQLEAKGYRIIASRFSGNGNVQTVQLFRDGQLYRIELTTNGNDVTSTVISKGILGNYEGRVESELSVQRHRVTDVGGAARVLNNVLSIAPVIRAGGVQIERDAAGTDAKFINRKALEDFAKKQGGKIDKIGERSITYEFGGETMKLDLQANGDVLVSRNGRFLGSYQFDGSDIGNGVQRATYDLINNVTSSPRFSERDVWQEMGYARKAGGRRNVLIVYDNERNEYYIIKVSKNGSVTTAMIPRDPNGFFARLEALQNMRTIEDVRFVYGSQFRTGYVEMVTDANGIYGMRSRTTGLATDDINDVQFLTDDEIDDIINNSANPSYNPDFMRNVVKVVGVSQYVSSTTTTPARIVDWVTVDDPSQVAGFIERAKGYGAMIADYDSMGSNISELGKAWNAPGEITADAGGLGLTDLYEGDYLNFEPDAYIDALEQQGTASARLSIEEDIKKVAKATRKAFQDMRDLLSRSSAYLPSITTYDIQALENSYRSVFNRRPRNITNAAIKARDIRRHFYRARLLQAKLHMEVLASDPEFYGNRIIDNTIRNTAYDPNWGNDELRLAVAEAEEFVLRLEEEFISLRDMQNSASFTRQIWDSLYPGQGAMYGSFIERIHDQGRDFRFSRDVNAGRAERNISILDELSRHPFLGQGALNDLIESGKLVILSTQQEIESALIRERGYAPHFSELGNIQGFASNDNQRVYLSEWGIKQGDAFRVLLHEFGIHAKYLGFRQAQFQEILAGIRQNSTAQTPEGRWIRLAIQKVESTNMKRNNPYFWEEVAAYLVEHSNEYAGLGILDQIQAWVKRWLFTNGYIDATNFHYQDFAIFSLGMLKDSRIPFRLMNGKFDYSKHQAGIYDARKFVEDYITDDLVNELGYSREELRELMAAHLVGTYKNIHVLGDLPDEEEFASHFPGMDVAWAEYRRDRSLDDLRFSRDARLEEMAFDSEIYGVEEAEVIAQYNDIYEKGQQPEGSNLDEREWAVSQTRSFKDWIDARKNAAQWVKSQRIDTGVSIVSEIAPNKELPERLKEFGSYNNVLFSIGFHSTRHHPQSFIDYLKYLGTGEGAQVHGIGVYVYVGDSEERRIANLTDYGNEDGIIPNIERRLYIHSRNVKLDGYKGNITDDSKLLNENEKLYIGIGKEVYTVKVGKYIFYALHEYTRNRDLVIYGKTINNAGILSDPIVTDGKDNDLINNLIYDIVMNEHTGNSPEYIANVTLKHAYEKYKAIKNKKLVIKPSERRFIREFDELLGYLEISSSDLDYIDQGQQYKLNIPDVDIEMLQENDYMSEQPLLVKNRLIGMFNELLKSFPELEFDHQFDKLSTSLYDTSVNRYLTARDFYKELGELEYRNAYGEKINFDYDSNIRVEAGILATMALRNAGIKGIHYNGNHNGDCAVIFDGSDIEILETYFPPKKGIDPETGEPFRYSIASPVEPVFDQNGEINAWEVHSYLNNIKIFNNYGDNSIVANDFYVPELRFSWRPSSDQMEVINYGKGDDGRDYVRNVRKEDSLPQVLRDHGVRFVRSLEESRMIQEQYAEAMKRQSDYVGNLNWSLLNRRRFIWENEGSFLAGLDMGDVFVMSHFAPKGIKGGAKMMKKAAESDMKFVAAVPPYQGQMLKKVGFKFVGRAPMPFHGEVILKDVYVNNAMTDEDVDSIKSEFMQGRSQEEIDELIKSAKKITGKKNDGDGVKFSINNEIAPNQELPQGLNHFKSYNNILFSIGWHSTPHHVQDFADYLKYLGTGEGAHVHGIGVYVYVGDSEERRISNWKKYGRIKNKSREPFFIENQIKRNLEELISEKNIKINGEYIYKELEFDIDNIDDKSKVNWDNSNLLKVEITGLKPFYYLFVPIKGEITRGFYIKEDDIIFNEDSVIINNKKQLTGEGISNLSNILSHLKIEPIEEVLANYMMPYHTEIITGSYSSDDKFIHGIEQIYSRYLKGEFTFQNREKEFDDFFMKLNIDREILYDRGQRYKLNIPDVDTEMLQEDEDVDQQPEYIKERLLNIMDKLKSETPDYEYTSNDDFFNWYAAIKGEISGYTARDFYKYLSMLLYNIENETGFMEVDFDEVAKSIRTEASILATKALREAGIKGIHYYGKEDGDCAAIFDGSDIEILETYFPPKKGIDPETGEPFRYSLRSTQPTTVEQGTAIPNAPGMYKMRDGSIQVHPEEVPPGRETETAIYAAVVLSEPAKNDPGIVDLREMIAADEVLREQVLAELSARGIEDNPDNEFVFGIRNVLQTREPEDPTYQAIVDVFHDVITKATGGVQDDILLTDNDIASAAHAITNIPFDPLLGEPVPTAPTPKETVFDKIEREHRMIEDRHRDIVENLIEVDENTGAVRFSIAGCDVFLDGNFRDTATDRNKQEFYAELERIHGTTHQYGEADGFYNQLASAQMTGTQEVRDYGALAQPADANRALVEDFIRRLNPEIYDKIQIEWVNTPDANTNLAGGLASFNPVGRGANKLIYIQGWGRTAGQVIRSAAWEASRFGWNSGIISNLKTPLARFYDLHESAIYQELFPYYTKYGITRGNVGDEHKVFLVQSYFAKMNQNILTGNPNALANAIGIDPATYKRIHDEVQNNVNTAVRDITNYVTSSGSISTDPEIAKAFAQDILRIVMGGMNGRGASFVYKTNGAGVSDTIYCYTNDFGLHRKPRLPADDENRHAHVAREIKENIEWWRKTFEPFGLGELAANFCKFFLRNFPMHNGLSFLHLNVPHARLGDSTITRATNLISRIWQRVDDPHGIEIRRNIAVMEKVQAILRDHHYDARWTQNATGGYEALFRSLGITDEKSLATAKLADHALPGMLAMIRENAGVIRDEFASTIDSLANYMEAGGVPAHEINRMSERMNAYAESFIDDYEHRSYEVYTTDGLDELVAMQHDLNIDPVTGEMGIYAKARQARKFISDTETRLRGRNAEFYRQTEEARKIVRRLERLESLWKYKEGKLLQAKSPLRGAELQEAVIKQMNDEIAARIKDIQDLKVEGRGSYKKFNYIPGSKRRKLDERLELDREYMNFLGRIEDPLMNAIYSIDQQRKIIEKLYFNKELGEHILSTGMGTISGSVVSTPVGAGTVGDLTNMENGTFLQYVSVDPIFLKEINNEYILNSRVRDSVLGGVIDVWKANNTIYSIKLGINNYVGNFSMLLASGHLWRYANWISAGQITKRQFLERFTDNLEDLDQFSEQVYKEMRDNRVVGGTMSEMNVMTYGRGHHEKILSMFLRHLRDAHILSNQGTFKAEEWVNNFLEKMKLTYAFGDEWVKPLMYLNNRANAIAKYESKLNPNDPRFAGDPEMWRAEVKRLAIQEAAEQTIRESVSWENSPQLIRALSQQNLRIFTPDFLMHNFQMVRITASNFMRLGECIRELSTLEVNNERDAKYQDALIKEIAQRSVGGAMTTATYAMLMGAAGSVMALVPYMFNVLFKSIEGEDGDDEEKGMFFDPQEWEGAQRLMNYKTGGNNLFVPVFRKDNKIYAWNYVRSSVMLTHAPVMPPTENPDLVDYGVIMFRNLVDLSNGTMTQQLINNMMGRDRWGREIGTLAGWGQVIERTMVPGFARQLAGVTLGYPLTDNLYHQGRLVKIPDLLGITVNEYDPRDIANQLAFDITAHNSNGKNVARRNFMERLLKGERLDDRQIVDMVNDMRERNAEEFGKANYVLTGLRQIGMTDKELMQWLTVSRKGGGDALGRKQAADFLKGKEIYDYALVTSLINQRKKLIEEGKKTRMSEEELAVAVGNFDRAIRIYKQSLRQ